MRLLRIAHPHVSPLLLFTFWASSAISLAYAKVMHTASVRSPHVEVGLYA